MRRHRRLDAHELARALEVLDEVAERGERHAPRYPELRGSGSIPPHFRAEEDRMKIAALIFDKITVLDIVGPIEVLSWVPDAEIVWVGKSKGQIRAAPTGLALTVEHTLDEVSEADILIVPGGPGVRLLLKDEPVLDWVRKMHARTKWTTSVCTGSLLLGAAGLLKGLEATTHWNSTHWNSTPMLESFGAKYREQRV